MKTLFLFIFLSAVSTTSQSSCQKMIPTVNRHIYVGNEISMQLERKKTGEVIRCSDPKFGEMICRTKEAEDCMFSSYIANCDGWKTLTPECGKKDPEDP